MKIPIVAFSYNTGDEGSMTGESSPVIINSIVKFCSWLTTQSAVVYCMIADVLVTCLTCTSLSQEAT